MSVKKCTLFIFICPAALPLKAIYYCSGQAAQVNFELARARTIQRCSLVAAFWIRTRSLTPCPPSGHSFAERMERTRRSNMPTAQDIAVLELQIRRGRIAQAERERRVIQALPRHAGGKTDWCLYLDTVQQTCEFLIECSTEFQEQDVKSNCPYPVPDSVPTTFGPAADAEDTSTTPLRADSTAGWFDNNSEEMLNADLHAEILLHDALHIVWLQPGYRYSYMSWMHGEKQKCFSLRRQLRALDTCTAAWYRRWQAVCLLQEIYDSVISGE